jgi:hypothetical protein
MSDNVKTKKIHCNRCGQVTNHVRHGEHSKVDVWGTDDDPFEDITLAELYVCAGCEDPTLMVTDVGNYYPDGYEAIPDFYPPRNLAHRRMQRFQKLPKHLTKIYSETVKALNSDSLLLCAIGLRTLLEGVCDDKKVKGGNLEDKIDSLRQFFPSSNITDSIHGFRFSGNEAAHQLVPLTKEEATTALDVMEGMLNYLYDLDYRASLIKHAQKHGTIVKPSQKKPITP